MPALHFPCNVCLLQLNMSRSLEISAAAAQAGVVSLTPSWQRLQDDVTGLEQALDDTLQHVMDAEVLTDMH